MPRPPFPRWISTGIRSRRLAPPARCKPSVCYGRDPNRLTADPTGQVAKALTDYPLPNNFQRGDGLNTAGFYWQEPGTNDNNLYNLRLDHILTQNTRLAFSMQLERAGQFNGYRGQVFPNQPSDFGRGSTNFYTLSATYHDPSRSAE